MTVRIEPNRRGGWKVEGPAPRTSRRCETLEDACRLGYLAAADTPHCELIVRDAYHRVVRRELVDPAEQDAPAGGGGG